MEQEIKSKFNAEIVRYGAALYDISAEELTSIGGSMNFVYEYQRNGHPYILRFTPTEHRSMDLVKGELDWLLYLHCNGLSVSIPVESTQKNLVEYVHVKDSSFIVTSFLKAKGKAVSYPDCLHDHELYYKCGAAVGKLHALSKAYTPSTQTIQRKDWQHNFYLMNMHKFIPADQTKVIAGCTNTISLIKKELPIDAESYGLTHGDIHVGNLRVNEGGITLFDFDEAQYSWFVDDIVTQLYYLVYVYGGDDGRELRESQATRFMEHFMRGYTLENVIDDYWIKKIPWFLLLREIIVYIGMYKNHPDLSKLNQWGKDYIAEAKIRIENGIPIVDIWN
ncbi:phosphotransferase [Paenibacillus sp. 7124]|uniref:Phosphotransferase n=1 Tax=Paenibacillus apii TaxID=1850370 RepID=A0A6M1PUA7_9BACL|nr:phosphotransferase [Paenibacillus apii]NGM83831.1 phosphotransferase [Paenibacillus apii]NJJ40640.1 phosphotransferase [Paenibacillus apii]